MGPRVQAASLFVRNRPNKRGNILARNNVFGVSRKSSVAIVLLANVSLEKGKILG